MNGNLEWVLRDPFALLNRMDRISLIEQVTGERNMVTGDHKGLEEGKRVRKVSDN